MCDELLFDFLHSEVINYAVSTNRSKCANLSSIEFIGFSTGYRIIERLTREWQRFKDELDTMKFICTDFWSCLYKKQIDNLRTNHQGVYVLQDNAFRFLNHISGSQQYLEAAPKYVTFTCGLIRGCLANLGINSIVTAELQTMPSVKFHITVNR
uniref:Trafficking protein particle complex subunit 6B n=1 Tax=Xenopsylla cheopis TaxID=163159 RepID=A0A6M2DPD3_XENCH